MPKSPKTVEADFEIHVIGRHVEVTEAMKKYAVEKVSKMQRFAHQILEATVTMDIQKLDHRVSIVLKVGHTLIKVSKSSENMYASIDMAVDKLQHKLWKYRSRLKEHHARPLAVVDLDVQVMAAPEAELADINDAIEAETFRHVEEALTPPEAALSSETYPLKVLTVEEALMKLDLSGQAFIVFKREDHPKEALHVAFKRDDGKIGVMELA